MAVTLKATATLNGKPYLATLKSLSSATAGLNNAAVKGSNEVRKGVLSEIAARETASRVVQSNAATVATSTRQGIKSTQQLTAASKTYGTELDRINRLANNTISRMGSMDAAQRRLALTGDALRRSQARFNEVNSTQRIAGDPTLAAATRDLAVRQAAYNQALEARRAAVHRNIDANRKFIESQSSLGKVTASAATGLAAQRYMFHDLSRQMALTSAGFAAFPALAIGVAASWEKTFADVVRTADPAFSSVDSRVDALRSSLVGMVQAMPISFKAVGEIATLANQMGIASSQTAEFTRAVAMFSATSGVSVDITATAFGRLTSIMGESRIGFMQMADAILKVGVNSVATESEIINVTTQISSIAQQAGMSTEDIIGLSGALASVRVPPELSRGVVTRVFGQIDKAVNEGSTGLQTLARLSGVSADQFRKDWGTERSAALFNGFLHGLRDAGAAARSELNSLGVTSVRDVPVMLRLANAADSEGNVGELLTQTMRDANNAAGETQRQYTIMAETVVSKLKLLGNNILAFFDAVGRSGLGMFGDVLDGVTKGIRNFTRSLEEPNKLLGMFGVTNGDIVGFIALLSLGVSAFTLLGSAAAKFFAAVATFRHAGAIMGIFGGGGAAAGGFSAFTAGAGKATKAAGLLRGGLGAVGSFLMGPWGIALGVGAVVLSSLNAKMQEGVTDTKKYAEALASIDYTYADGLDEALKKITVAGPSDLLGWDLNSNPFSKGVEDFRSSLDELIKIREQNTYDWFGGKQTFAFGEWIDRTFKGKWDEIDGIKVLDESVQNLVDGGNSLKAAQMLQQLARSGEDLTNVMSLTEGQNIKAFLRDAFALADIDMTAENLDKFANGTLVELTDAMAGVKGATIAADDLFEGDFERLGQFAKIFDEASASFINFSASLESATLTDDDGNFAGFDLNKWSEALNEQVTAQQTWATNIREIAKHASTDVVEALASMGPEGQMAAAELAAGLAAGTPEAVNALSALEAAVLAQAEGFGTEVAEIMANIDWVKGAASSAEISQQLISQFSDVDLSLLRSVGQGLGQETIAGVLDGLAEHGSIDQALNELLNSKPAVNVSIDFSETGLTQGLAGLQARLQKEHPEVEIQINTATTVAELQAMLNDPVLNAMEIDTTLTIGQAYEEVRAFQSWAQLNEVDMFLGVNDTPARFTVNAMVDYGNGLISTMQLDALTAPAEGALWEFVTMADGTTGFVQIDADKSLVEQKLYQVDALSGEVQTVPLDGDESAAVEAIVRTRNAAKEPATIGIKANTTAFDTALSARTGNVGSATISVSYVAANSPSAIHGGRITEADGGVLQFYANGGVRENHTAQIAPAGAMRVWAEPETGGEAYIPLARSKRARSEAILDNVASRFGYSLVRGGQDAARYASGGYYQAQMFSRQNRQYTARSQDNANNRRDVSMTFINPVTRDPLQDAWEKMQEFGDL